MTRNVAMCAMVLDGASLRQAGAHFKVFHERVRQILQESGLVYSNILQSMRDLKSQQEAAIRSARPVRVSTTINGKPTPEYGVYRNMLGRCYNPGHMLYKDYGGRGVTVCERWLGRDGFRNFYADKCPRPEGEYASGRALYSIHRIDGALVYSPETTKWATSKEQNAPGQRRTENIGKSSGAAAPARIAKLHAGRDANWAMRRKMTYEKAKEMRALYTSGRFTQKVLGLKFGISLRWIEWWKAECDPRLLR